MIKSLQHAIPCGNLFNLVNPSMEIVVEVKFENLPTLGRKFGVVNILDIDITAKKH